MTSKSLRRLANDTAHLHKHGLPPHYLWPSAHSSAHDLAHLSVLLAGPESTPFSAGLFRLELRMDSSAYPQTPPTAHFRTKIFHPNVDASTGAVCVDTLKRDWRPDLTLRDVLVTIASLLLCPNYASALNAEAGVLLKEDQGAYERRAKLWVGMYAGVPAGMEEAVSEARGRVEGGAVPVGSARRRRRREAMGAGEEVCAPTQGGGAGNENAARDTQQAQSTATGRGHAPATAALHTPLQHIQTPGQEQRGLGLSLGLSASNESESASADVDASAVMDLDTPSLPQQHTHAHAPRKNVRKRYAMLPPAASKTQTHATASSSPFSAPLARAQTQSQASALPSYIPSSSSSAASHPHPLLDPSTPEPPSKRRRTDSLSPPALPAPLFALAASSKSNGASSTTGHTTLLDTGVFTPPPSSTATAFHRSPARTAAFATPLHNDDHDDDDNDNNDDSNDNDNDGDDRATELVDRALGIPPKSAAQKQRYALMKKLVQGDVRTYNRAGWAPPRGIFRC